MSLCERAEEVRLDANLISVARMRIISWNCGSGFHRKIEALLALAPDVAVVQECADLDSLARKAPEFAPTGALWTGGQSA